MLKNEKIWVKHNDKNGKLCFVTSSKKDRSMYFLYDVRKAEPVLITKSTNPLDFDKVIKQEISN